MGLEKGTFLTKLEIGRLVLMYLLFISLFGVFFYLLSFTKLPGISYNDGAIERGWMGVFDSVYFSIVTSTSLGYGDIRPHGFSRVLAVIEVFISLIIFGILISKILYKSQDKILEQLYQTNIQRIFTKIVSGLYNFRAEIDNIIIRLPTIRKRDIGEVIQNIESNLDMMSVHIDDSHHLLLELNQTFRKEIIIENIHNSLSKVEDLIHTLRKTKFKFETQDFLIRVNHLISSTEHLCVSCQKIKNKDFLKNITKLKKHLEHLRNNMYKDHGKKFKT